jgi:hypothetical protein
MSGQTKLTCGQHSTSPTLLSCSAYELSLNCCWYTYDRLRRPRIKEDKAIVEVEPLNVNQQLEDMLCQTKKLIDIMQRVIKRKEREA